ncbi:hypothetical protein RHGRI_011854 [Rhododendron griersonianum]|uniref:Purple acid phosphatase n=1 Tax=Rhododendron griersonianum TaxID=479676 RepID=A0AAV6KPY3_9ERIC|nr:hypothetical protein RHGRI_011854 [Rhododendron griersonianum]
MVAMTCFQKQALLFVLKWTFVFWLNAVSSFSELQRFTHPGKGDGSLSFLVVGDWGRDGLYNQSEVAFQMGRIGEELDLDFVVSTGDNFYDNGLKAVNDPAFRESFSEIYSYKSLRKPWYSVLGNHDYRGDVKAQLDPILRRIDRRWFCLRSFVLNAAEIADFFFVDTTPFVDAYFNEPEDHIYDWRGIYPRETYVSNLLKANNVDFYMNGHDHCLERISCRNSRIQFLTSGAGSKAWRGDEKLRNDCAVHFFYDGQGFMSVQLSSTNAQMRFYDVDGKAMYQWNVTRQLHFHSEM